MSVNISGIDNPNDIVFYFSNKSNTTDNWDRGFQGDLIGPNIYLNETFDLNQSINISFPTKSESNLFFYLDDNINIFSFLLNVTGFPFGFFY